MKSKLWPFIFVLSFFLGCGEPRNDKFANREVVKLPEGCIGVIDSGGIGGWYYILYSDKMGQRHRSKFYEFEISKIDVERE